MANSFRYDPQQQQQQQQMQHPQYHLSQHPNAMIETLWTNTMKVLWQYLDAEQSMEKLKLRRQLEKLIYDYLCNVSHDRKFVFEQTLNVLKSSIAKLHDFSAYKAAFGFEAISQYANNLFAKPWRKEYKTIKMYSGFYKHEIASNLDGAEVLFEQMGYRMLEDKQTLVLDEPVCPDRVTNVSRDIITAYVECRIMGDIYADLSNMKLTVNWSDIYNFRECNIMDRTQSVQQMAMIIQEKHQKNHHPRRKESYGNALATANISCNTCHPYYLPHMQQQQLITQLPPMGVHPPPMPFCGSQPVYNSTQCSIHNQPPYSYHHHYPGYLPNSPSQPTSQPSAIPAHPPPPPLPHSKSLEHYQDSSTSMYNLTACMQRHSLDQSYDYNIPPALHYGGPMGMGAPSVNYDAIDGCGMAYNKHPYNVSGNRIPLPYQLSANLGSCMNGSVTGKQNGTEPFYQQPGLNCYPPQMTPYNHHRSFSSGQLHGPPIPKHVNDIYMNHNFDQGETQPVASILSKKKSSYDDYDVPSTRRGSEVKPTAGELIYIDSREDTKKERKKSERCNDLLSGFESDILPEVLLERQHRHLHHQMSRNSRQSDFDSYEDEQLQAGANQRANNVNKRISSKNQDGFGSYESWNYVFQNLEQQGYTKDLGERGDVLVEGEEEEVFNEKTSRTGTLTRTSKDKLKQMKPKAADKVDGIRVSSTRQSQTSGTKYDRDNERNETISRSNQKASLVQKLSKPVSNIQTDNSHQANHSSHSGTSTINAGGSSSRRNSITRKTSTSNRDNVVHTTTSSSSGGGILINHNSSNYQSSSSTTGKKKTTSFDTAGVTIINPQGEKSNERSRSNGPTGTASEWNCKFCTFLNPDTRRVCEMCSKSRDFDLNAQTATKAKSNGAATCV